MKIPGFPDYDISTDGVVTRIRDGMVCTRYAYSYKGHQYARVTIKDANGNSIVKNVLYLLAITYTEAPDGANVVQPKDGNGLNVALDNIKWISRSKISKEIWDTGKMAHKRQRPSSIDENAITMVLETLRIHTSPVTMAELSCLLEVPYFIVRYSMQELLARGDAKRTKHGYKATK